MSTFLRGLSVTQSVTHWIDKLNKVDPTTLSTLPDSAQQSIHRQAIIGWSQTLILVLMLIQVAIAGALRALPPEVRSAVSFLHRIEWGVYATLILIGVQVILAWRDQVLLTNRFYLLGWHLSRPRLLVGKSARAPMLAFGGVMILLVGAILWVRVNGFIVQPARILTVTPTFTPTDSVIGTAIPTL